MFLRFDNLIIAYEALFFYNLLVLPGDLNCMPQEDWWANIQQMKYARGNRSITFYLCRSEK